MKRSLLLLSFVLLPLFAAAQDRPVWVETMTRIAEPVLAHLADGTLKADMPFESFSTNPLRREVSYLEAFGRTVCGIAPWLELGPDETPEGQLRAPTQIWGRLDDATRKNLIDAWKTSRQIQPYESNWLLFASIIEAALLEFTGDFQPDRLYDGVVKFRYRWYKGDAWYGDGEDFHLDYYNSLVIHPMLTEVLQVMARHGLPGADFLPEQERRLGRYAAQLERMISPEGTYPVIGRSIAYRFGSFHALSDAAFLHLLPADIDPAQVRCGLTAVISRQAGMPGTFDEKGWLTVGYAGHQPRMGEEYINTGSVYLCMAVFLPLGLPESDPFWSRPAASWTSRKAWEGIDVGADHAL